MWTASQQPTTHQRNVHCHIVDINWIKKIILLLLICIIISRKKKKISRMRKAHACVLFIHMFLTHTHRLIHSLLLLIYFSFNSFFFLHYITAIIVFELKKIFICINKRIIINSSISRPTETVTMMCLLWLISRVSLRMGCRE